MNKNRAEFAHALRQGKTVWAAGVYDALSAKLAEAARFQRVCWDSPMWRSTP
jgi:2-methylisocitrate lyase-like PEP mutase family enzyme